MSEPRPVDHRVIYVQLLNEGTVVFRPVESVVVGPKMVRLGLPDDYNPDGEEWEFPPGSTVRIETQKLSGGEAVVAVQRVDSTTAIRYLDWPRETPAAPYRVDARQVAFLGHLAHMIPPLHDVMQEHLDDNENEILPHLLIADFERWAERAAIEGDPTLKPFLAELEAAFVGGGEALVELISVSFVEHLPSHGEPGDELLQHLGTGLAEEARRLG